MNSQIRTYFLFCLTAVLVLSPSILTAQDLGVESISIDDGAVNVPELVDISVTFTGPLAPVSLPGALDGIFDTLPIDLDLLDPDCPLPPAGIFILPGGCAESIQISNGGRTVTLENVQLAVDSTHMLLVLYAFGQNGESLAVPSVTTFSTGPTLPQGGIAGSVSTSGSSPAGTVVVAIQAPLSFDGNAQPAFGFADESGAYNLKFMEDGTFHVVALGIDFTVLEEALKKMLVGTVDGDNDQVADEVMVDGGAIVTGANIAISADRSTAAELNTPALALVQLESPTAMLSLAAGAGLDVDGTALTWLYLYASLPTSSLWATAGLGSFIFPPQLVDLGEDSDSFVGILGPFSIPSFGDSDMAVQSFLDVGGAEFLADYPEAIGGSVLMNAELFAFVELLLSGDVGGLGGFGEPARFLLEGLSEMPDPDKVLSKQTGEVWVVGFLAPGGPALHMVAMDDAGDPLLVVGSSPARANEAAASAAAMAWAADAVLVTVSTDLSPIDGRGSAIAWGFNYYSASKDSVVSVAVSGGAFGGVLTTQIIPKEDVPSVSALPDNWIDSPAAVMAARTRGAPFILTHADALSAAVLSKGLQEGNPDLAIWRFAFTGTSVLGESDFLEVDIDAESGIFVAAEDDRVLPTGFELGQNYPNPFNPVTVIPYKLAERGVVTLEIFDALGRRVATLVNDVVPAGSYEAVWDASQRSGAGVPSGIYVYRLTADGAVSSRTMMLLK